MEDNFWRHVHKIPFHTCWEWFGGANRNSGYGQVSYKGVPWLAHRLSWVLHGGQLPPGKSLLHSCDNKLCVNPAHLRLGTQDDNMKDMSAKGRSLRGSTNPASKLTEEKVREILRDKNRLPEELAEAYGVSRKLITLIKQRKIWKHVA